MAKLNEGETPGTVPQTAPGTPVQEWIMPRHKTLEGGGFSSPVTQRHPEVRGGICEFCGVLDGRYPSTEQYKLCPHYRGMELSCVYCPQSKNPVEVIGHSVLKVWDSPTNPNELIACCDASECLNRHWKRFNTARS